MKIAILAAMDKEVALLKNIVEDAVEETVENMRVLRGHISGHEVILAKCGIGKVNSALNAYRIIRRYAPQLVINSGVAGGAGALKIGELLVATEGACHDVWCGPGTEMGAADGFPQRLKTSEAVCEIARRELGENGISYGLIATGDKFISTPEEIKIIREIFPDVQAVDMESTSILQTCAMEGVECAILRVVSDTPGEGENISQYKDFWSEAPAKTFQSIRTILESL